LPGAEGIYLELREEEEIKLRVEVPAQPGEKLSIRFRLDHEGRPVAECPGRCLLHLATDASWEPSTPLLRPAPGAPLDLALLVDGSTRIGGHEGGRLLADTEAWQAQTELLTAFAQALAEGTGNAQIAVLAFADAKPPQTQARDLEPAYCLYPPPPARTFCRLEAMALGSLLRTIPPSSGGDFVDELASGLEACRRLHWRPEARKVLFLFGDSPGFSILYPAPPAADAGARLRDVDGEALELHKIGVEIATLYHGPAPEELAAALPMEKDLLDFAVAQYGRLASQPELAFSSQSFVPQAAAKTLRALSGRLGRAATWGEWMD
jgi:hypothetical protein